MQTALVNALVAAVTKYWPNIEPLLIQAFGKLARDVIQKAKDGTFPERWKFADPPYADTARRTEGLYATDCEQVAHRVREWAIEQGSNPLMRIVLAGYDGEHDMPNDWRVHEWEATGGYGLIGDDEQGTGRANKGRERLWFSPHCVKAETERHGSLFAEAA